MEVDKEILLIPCAGMLIARGNANAFIQTAVSDMRVARTGILTPGQRLDLGSIFESHDENAFGALIPLSLDSDPRLGKVSIIATVGLRVRVSQIAWLFRRLFVSGGYRMRLFIL